MIIGLCGFQGSGKDTVADVLCANHSYVRISFAGILKDVCAAIFGWDREMLEGRTAEARAEREVVDEWWAKRLGMPYFTPREALQQIGTQIFRRYFHADIWLAALEKRIGDYENVVITDCRFPNEIALLRSLGGIIVNIQRGAQPDWVIPYKTMGVKPAGVHESEYVWTAETFDYVVKNDGSLADLEKRLKDIL